MVSLHQQCVKSVSWLNLISLDIQILLGKKWRFILLNARIHEIIHKDRGISIVFEYIDWDLKAYMESLKKSSTKSKGCKSAGLPGTLVKVGKKRMSILN